MKWSMQMLSLIVGAWLVGLAVSLENGLARTPPMGWMSWERYMCNVDCKTYPENCLNEALIKRTADAMQEKGLAAAGYEYLIIDDCWFSRSRDPDTLRLRPDPERFPSGMKAVGDYVRSKGLKFGIYLDFGTKTCAGYPGSELFMSGDVDTMKSWGVEYIKMDGCYAVASQYPEGYETFSKLIKLSGHPMVFSCSYPAYLNWEKDQKALDWNRLEQNCNLWRMYYDISDNWEAIRGIIKLYKDHNETLYNAAGPGHWNDPDMLMVGNFGLSRSQAKAQMGLWAMFAAPLLMSTEVSSLSEESLNLLKNPRLISINQDPLGKQGVLVVSHGSMSVWRRELSDGKWAIAVLNEAEIGGPTKVAYTPSQLGLFSKLLSPRWTVEDVFTGNKLANLGPSDVLDILVYPSSLYMVTFVHS